MRNLAMADTASVPPPLLLLLVWSLALCVVPVQTLAGDVIYRYTDASGTVSFTDDWESIPQKYRSHVETLSSTTLLPLHDGGGKPTTVPPPPGSMVQEQTDSLLTHWLGKVAKIRDPIQSHAELAVGLTILILMTVMMLKVWRCCHPIRKRLLMTALVCMTMGVIYGAYVFGAMNWLTNASNSLVRLTSDRADPMTILWEKTSHLRDLFQGATGAQPGDNGKESDGTVMSTVTHTVEKANAAARERDTLLNKIERPPSEIAP